MSVPTTVPTPGRVRATLATVVLLVFVAVSVARLAAIPAGLSDLSRYSTYFLMSTLAVWVLVAGGPALMAVGLLFSCAGDILLGMDGLFLAGMGAFAAAHVCYVTHFLRTGAARGLRRRWWLVPLYAAILVALVVWLWSGLGDLRVPVLVYALLLAATAVTSASLGVWLGIGGALFFASDAMIAAFSLADKPEPPMPGMWIMVTYILAQLLLAIGAVARAKSASGAVARAESASGAEARAESASGAEAARTA
jgi:uncharacterized membrane protein YhhN